MSNTRVFFISDTHFNHTNILKFEALARPFHSVEAMNTEMVHRWNEIVREDDIVWHLGDVFLGGKSTIKIIRELNGHKRLIMGNHDHYGAQYYLDNGFEKVYGVLEKYGWILSHMPVASTERKRFKLNVHGHIHSGYVKDPWYYNVSCEEHNLTPVRLEVIKEYEKELYHG